MRRIRSMITAALLLSALVVPLSGSTAQAGPDPTEVDEFTVYESYIEIVPQISGPWVAYDTIESDEGADLNGDGDQLDRLVRLVDTRTRQERNTELTVAFGWMGNSFALRSNTIAVTIPESEAGGVDLNGDGDAIDRIHHLYDITTQAVTNLGVAAPMYDSSPTGVLSDSGSLYAMLVGEQTQGDVDLNGDGDTNDTVIHVREGSVTRNLGLAAGSIFASDDLVLFTVSEADQGGTDLNGDGDATDGIAYVFEAGATEATNLGIPGSNEDWVAGSVGIMRVSEYQHGGADLNDDGDTFDYVMFVYDSRDDTTTNVGLIAPSSEFGHVGTEDLICFTVYEPEQGGEDLDGDGNSNDSVVHFYEPATREISHLVGSGNCGGMGDGFVLLNFSEQGTDIDLNGDGDMFDQVPQVLDLSSGQLSNLGIGGWSDTVGGDWVIIGVEEDNLVDLNGDGDGADRVPFLYDHADRTLVNLGVAMEPSSAQIGLGLASFVASEPEHGETDLNGDGDSVDSVVQLVPLTNDKVINGGRAVRSWWAGPVGDGFATALVSEEYDGWTDHNGDGDKNDEPLFIMFPIPENLPPMADANGPYAANQGALISLSSAGSADDDGTIESWAWDFGDGATSTLANPSHAYLEAGSYSVSLTVTDDDGDTDSDSATVTVARVDAFQDDDGSVFELDAEWMAAAGITKGCNPPVNDKFCPDAYVTRGQMAAFLTRALELTERADDPFIDDDGSIFEADIERLAYSGITKGCNPAEGNTKFCPESRVTRGQMAAFLVRALEYTDIGDGDLFIDDDGSIFEADIDKLGTAGVTKGCNPAEGNTKFCPDAYVTRGQMAAFLHRALG